MKKILSVLLSVVLIVSVFPIAFAKEGNTVILYTNDVHCAYDGYAYFAAYKSHMEKNNTVITIDAGDAVQGEAIGMLTEGERLITFMNLTGYDYAVPGNHEFDYGVGRLLEIAEKEAEFTYICSNFYSLEENEPVFSPYVIEEGANGERIALIGISTPETLTKSSPDSFKNENGEFIYAFPSSPDEMTDEMLYDNVQKSVDSAKADGADIVIAIGHMGIKESKDGWKSTDIIGNTHGIDIFIDAHSHETIEGDIYKNKLDEDVILTSTGTKFADFGELTISEGTEISTRLIDTRSLDVDALGSEAVTVFNEIQAYSTEVDEEVSFYFDPIGITQAKLIAADSDGVRIIRKQETNMGDFVTDAFCFTTGSEIALANSGGVRSVLNIGNVSRLDLMNVFPYGNTLCVAKLSGQQIVDALEYGARLYPELSGSFLQVSSSLSYEIDVFLESPVIVDSLDNFAGIKEGMPRRVKNVMYLGEPIDLDRIYTVTASKFVVEQGGDGFLMFKGAETTDVNERDYETLIKYVISGLDGFISSEKYGNPNGEGRIKINTEPQKECDHICHSESPFWQFIWKIYNFLMRIFSMERVCACGEYHY